MWNNGIGQPTEAQLISFSAVLMILFSALTGCDRTNSVNLPSSPSGTTFGHRQLDQLLADRPDMHAAIPESHPVRRWLVDGFNGKLVGRRVYWNRNEPESGRSAEHSAAYEQYPPQIRIAKDESSAIDKWAAAVYEMLNMSNTEKFEAIQNQALEGEIDSETYAEQCVRLEFDALLQTREYFEENPLPSNRWTDAWYCWVTTMNESYEAYKSSHGKEPGSHGNFQYFKQYYLDEIVPYQESLR